MGVSKPHPKDAISHIGVSCSAKRLNRLLFVPSIVISCSVNTSLPLMSQYVFLGPVRLPIFVVSQRACRSWFGAYRLSTFETWIILSTNITVYFLVIRVFGSILSGCLNLIATCRQWFRCPVRLGMGSTTEIRPFSEIHPSQSCKSSHRPALAVKFY